MVSKKQSHFNMTMGSKLHVHIDDQAPYSAFFIGMKKREYLIITQPEPRDEFKNAIQGESRIIVKYRRGGTVYAFKTSLAGALADPLNLILLAYPQQVQTFELRSFQRNRCFMPTRIFDGSVERSVVMEDINIRGCRCKISHTDNKEPLFKIHNKVELACCFPGVGNELVVSAIIKNLNFQGDAMTIGLEFVDLTPKFHQAVANYIYSINPMAN